MKRINNLITEEKITVDFCKQAIIDAAKNKHHKLSVIKVLDNLDYYAEKLRCLVINNTFIPNEYKYEERIEHGKLRKLQKPKFFPDQCVHHVLIKVIEKQIYKRIDYYAVAGIKGRGQKRAINSIKRWIRKDKQETQYIIKGDIKKFFDNVKPEIVMRCYSRFIKDKKYLALKRKIVYSCNSLPLGNYCSVFDANLLLKELDEVIRSQPTVKHYVRYMDDFVAFCDDYEKAKLIKPLIEKVLDKHKLTLKENYQVFRLADRGLDFIGYRFYPNRVILRKRVYKNIIKQISRISKLRIIPVKEAQSLMSRLGTTKHCYATTLAKRVNKAINIILIKSIISENSKALSYSYMGIKYKPKRILV